MSRMRVPARDPMPPPLPRSRWDTQSQAFNAYLLKPNARCCEGLFDRLLHPV